MILFIFSCHVFYISKYVYVITNSFYLSVLISAYERFNLRVNDVFVSKNNTAVLRCEVNPYYVRDYVKVESWTKNGRPIITGSLL